MLLAAECPWLGEGAIESVLNFLLCLSPPPLLRPILTQTEVWEPLHPTRGWQVFSVKAPIVNISASELPGLCDNSCHRDMK